MKISPANAFGKTVFPHTARVSADLLRLGDSIPVNCKITREGLIPTLSPRSSGGSVPENIKCVSYAVGIDRYMAFADGKDAVSFNGFAYSGFLNRSARSPFIIERRLGEAVQTLTFGDGSVAVYNKDDELKTEPYAGNLACGAFHCGRLFGADLDDGYKLRWSGEGGALDWEEKINGAGWVLLCPELGEILNVAEFGEKIIALRRRGVSVITAHGSPENFKVESEVFSYSELCKDTVQIVRGRLFFFRKSGLCEYSGGKILSIANGLAEDFFSPACSAATDEYYFAGGNSMALGDAVFAYDAADDCAFLMNASAEKIAAGRSVFCYADGKCCELVPDGEFTFSCGNINFGSHGKKTLKSVIIDGGGDYSLTVTNGVFARSFNAAKGKTRLNMCGRSFKITVSGSKRINSFTAEAEVADDV